MAKVLDRIIVELTGDRSAIARDSRRAAEAVVEFGDNVHVTLEDIHKGGLATQKHIRNLTEQAVAWFAALEAAREIRQWAKAITASDAAVGRAARQMGMSVSDLGAWRGAIKSAGGDTEHFTHVMMKLSSDFARYRVSGEYQLLEWMRWLNLKSDPSTMTQWLKDFSGVLQKYEPVRAAAIAAQYGFSAVESEFLRRGPSSVAAALKSSRQLAPLTEADVAAAQRWQDSMTMLQLSFTDLGRKIKTALTYRIVPFIDSLTELSAELRDHGEFLRAAFLGLAGQAVILSASILGMKLLGVFGIAGLVGIGTVAIIYLFAGWRAWMRGEESRFGELYREIADSIEGLRPYWEPILEDFKSMPFAEMVKDGLALSGAMWNNSLDDTRNASGKFWGDLKRIFSDLVDAASQIGGIIIHSIIMRVGGYIGGRWGAIMGALFKSGVSGGEGKGGAAPTSDEIRDLGGHKSAVGWGEDIPLSGGAAGRSTSLTGMTPDFRARLAAMIAKSPSKTTVFSGYRSEEVQEQLRRAPHRPGFVAMGTSHHTLGEAADIKGDIEWFHKHAPEYGLHFPMNYEPWHIQKDPKTSVPAPPEYLKKYTPRQESSLGGSEGAKAAAGLATNSKMSRHETLNDIRIGEITVKSQASDSRGISADINRALRNRISAMA